jgi:hypothetical protein
MPKPKQKRIIVLQSSNHDSESGSLRDAIARSQDESTESEGWDSLTGEDYSNGNDSSGSGTGNDILIGGYSEIRPIFEILTLPPQRLPISSFTNTIEGEVFSFGASSVEATLLLPAIQGIREHLHLSGTSSFEITFTPISVNNNLEVIL